MILMSRKQFFGILIVIIAVGLVATLIWSLNDVYRWLGNETQEMVIALVLAIVAGVLIETVYKKLQPQPKMLKTTQTRIVDHDDSSAKLILPNNSNIIVKDPEKIIGREDFLGVVTSDKLYFIGKDHLKITRKNNSFYIQDLKTKNGTTVNGIQLEGDQTRLLYDGDEIIVAKSLNIKYQGFWGKG